MSAAQTNAVQSVETRNKKINTGINTHSFKTFRSVFSGTLMRFAASSKSAMRSVKGLSSSVGIFLVEVYIFKECTFRNNASKSTFIARLLK